MANKILLADDSITIQKVVNLTFTDEGINVVTVGNGELALRKLGEDAFDLVLADIFMPGRNGYEVCEYVKTSPQFADIPVLLLVGAFEPFDKSEAARVRADGHLTKPFESRILVETVKRLLAEAAARKAAAAPPPPPAEPQGTYKGQVVGWDVPTVPVPRQQLDEEEPGPPSYDPYVSTGNLPPLPRGVTQYDEGEGEPSAAFSDQTMSIGSPIPTGALFSPPPARTEAPPAEAPASEEAPAADKSEPFTFSATGAIPIDSPSAIKGPPDSLPGFSFATSSGPLPSFEAPPEEEAAARPVVSRQEPPDSESPLDLAEEAVVEQHTHEPAVIEERRDPMLETFADVAESTARVGGAADPNFVDNAIPEGTPSMTVQPMEDVTSAWDPQAQPPRAFDEKEEAHPPGGAWGTSSYEVGATPFALADEAPLSDGTPFEMPAESESPFSMPPGISEEAARAPLSGETLRAGARTTTFTPGAGSATQRFTPEEVDELAAADEVPTHGDENPLQALETAPTDWTPEVEPVPDEEAEVPAAAVEADSEESVAGALAAGALGVAGAMAGVSALAGDEAGVEAEAAVAAEAVGEEPVAAAPANGSGAAHALPQELVDEVVRRAMARINDDVIREIAWEVVPDIAERMIRRRLGDGE